MVAQFSEQVSQAMKEAQDSYDAYASAIGRLCIEWAELDVSVDWVFQPLLNCTEAQAGAILPENMETRTSNAIKLIHSHGLDVAWTSWAADVLKRASPELARQRNRIVHDSWKFRGSIATRIEKRAKVVRPAVEAREILRHNESIKVTLDYLEKLQGRVVTVTLATRVVVNNLRRWRSESIHPQIDPQWFLASKQNYRCTNFQLNLVALERPSETLRYEEDRI